MRLLLLATVLGCSSPSAVPATRGGIAAMGDAALPDGEIDAGELVTTVRGQVFARERFTVNRVGEHIVIRTKFEYVEDARNNFAEGELELDAKYRPVRAAFRRVTPADGYEYRLGGSPLKLDVTRDDKRRPRHLVAEAGIDVFLEGPGTMAMTPLCRVTGERVLTTFGDEREVRDRVEAYRGAPVGAYQRIILEGFEVMCDGDRLIAGGNREFDAWFVRADMASALEALKAAPAPDPHVWKHPGEERLPWDPLGVVVLDEVTITNDRRTRSMRLTAYDKGGKRLVHRDLWRGTSCERFGGAKLVCVDGAMGYAQIIDAATLADRVDLTPAIAKAAPEVKPSDRWAIIAVVGTHLHLEITHERAIDLDLEKLTAVPIPVPKYADRPETTAANLCATGPAKVGGVEWTIVSPEKDAAVQRKVGGKLLPPVPIKIDRPDLVTCPGGGVYVIQHDDHSVLARLAADGSVAWSTEVGYYPGTPHLQGGLLVMGLAKQDRRLVALDPATGAVTWVAEGWRPVK